METMEHMTRWHEVFALRHKGVPWNRPASMPIMPIMPIVQVAALNQQVTAAALPSHKAFCLLCDLFLSVSVSRCPTFHFIPFLVSFV